MKPDFKKLDKTDLEVISKPLRRSELEEISHLLKDKKAKAVLAIAPVKNTRSHRKY